MIATKQLRELAALRPEGHKVLSLYLNLDPSEFPTPQRPHHRVRVAARRRRARAARRTASTTSSGWS